MDHRDGLEVNRLNPNRTISNREYNFALLNNEHVTLGEDDGYKRVGIVKQIRRVNKHRTLHFNMWKEKVTGD